MTDYMSFPFTLDQRRELFIEMKPLSSAPHDTQEICRSTYLHRSTRRQTMLEVYVRSTYVGLSSRLSPLCSILYLYTGFLLSPHSSTTTL